MARPVGESGVARRGRTLGEVSRRAEGAVTRAKAAPGPAEAAAAGDGAAEPAAPMADAGEARQPLPFAPSSMEIPAPEAVAGAVPAARDQAPAAAAPAPWEDPVTAPAPAAAAPAPSAAPGPLPVPADLRRAREGRGAGLPGALASAARATAGGAVVSAVISGGDASSGDAIVSDAREAVSAPRAAAACARSARQATSSAVLGGADALGGAMARAQARLRRLRARAAAVPSRGPVRERVAAAARALLAPAPPVAAGGAAGGAVAAGAAGGGAAALAIALLLALVLLAGAMGAVGGASRRDFGDMDATERAVATYLLAHGLDEVHVAAIMGNMSGESGGGATIVADRIQAGGGGPYDTNANLKSLGTQSGIGAGICQWDGGRRWALASYADSVGRPWTDLQVQLDFFWSHDEWGRGWGRGENTEAAFMATSDLAAATRIFLRGWERAGVEHLDVRLAAARRYRAALGGAVSDGVVSAAQQAIVQSAGVTPSPGAGLCAAWVSHVFSGAGMGSVPGNACDMYRDWCHSSSKSELRPGMIIAVATHPHTAAGRVYGHVGIYVGGNTVMDNVGPIRRMDLDEWISYFGTTCEVRWGWAMGRDLSAS